MYCRSRVMMFFARILRFTLTQNNIKVNAHSIRVNGIRLCRNIWTSTMAKYAAIKKSVQVGSINVLTTTFGSGRFIKY